VSLLHALADRVLLVRGSLPVAEVGLAAGRLRDATALLASTLETSSVPSPAPLLAAAASHLDSAVGALGRVGDELDRYLAAVGVLPASVVVPDVCPWADRVDVLTGLVGAPRPAVDPRLSVGAVLVAAASARDRVALREVLVAAPPSVGWALAARAAGLAGVADAHLVRRAVLSRLPALLPGLPAPAAEALVCRAPRLPAAEASAHPADAAAVAVVLVTVVSGLTGASLESLAGVSGLTGAAPESLVAEVAGARVPGLSGSGLGSSAGGVA
jgi:hypothetical protein